MDIPALIARFRLLGGPEGAAAARALLASINSAADIRMKTPLDQIRSLEAIAANDVSRYAVVGGAGPRHWEQEPRDQTGKWTSGGGASPKAKQEHPGKSHAQEIHAVLDQPPEKAAAGLVGLLKKSATKAGDWFHALESLAHAAWDFVKGRLPAPVVKPVEKTFGAMFATYTAGQSVVARIARGQGLDEAAVKKRVNWCKAVDLAGAKLLSVAGGAAGGAVGGTAASMLPLGSTAYVIGSLFASPQATSEALADSLMDFVPEEVGVGMYAKADPYAEEALALADLHAGLFNSYLDCGLGISADEIERAQAELADVGGRIEYADGQWRAFADDSPGGVKMYGRWHWAGEEQDEPLRFAASEWVAEKSTRSKNPSGNRYRNTRTGQIRYFKKPPATREQRQEEFRSKGDVDREKLKERTKGHAQADDAAVKKQAANAFRALFYHHGDFVVHRLQELADDTEMALGKAQEGTPAHDALKRKMAALDAMLAHADERGITGKVPPKMIAEQAPAEPWTGKGEPELGKVYNAPTEALNIDPKRFQFKLKTDASGVTQELKAVQTWNPDFAGTLAVWKDPQDGKTYVVNGHHRRELAGRLNVADMAVRYIDAKTPEEARAKGALINIAEGRGTPVDAAKFMRDTGTGPEEMKKTGVSLKGKLAEDAVALTALSDKLFDRVARDDMEIGRALAIGRNLPDHARQEKLVKILDKREEDGKDISLRTVEEMAREMAAVPAVTRNDAAEGMGLFGNEDYEDDVFVERNELKGYIRNQLAQDVNDFAVVASKRRAEKVAGAGNVLDTEKNNTFDGLVNLKGPVSSALNEAAKEYAAAKGKKAKDAAKQRALEAVRAAVAAESGAGQQSGSDKPSPVAQGGDGAGASDAAGKPAAADDAGRTNPGESGLNSPVPLAEQGKVSDNSSGGEGPPKENENGRQDHDPGRVPEREAVSADDANGVRRAEPERPAADRRDELRRRDGGDRIGQASDGGGLGDHGRVDGETPVRFGPAEAAGGGGEGRQPGQAGQQQVNAEPVFTAKQRVREHLGKGDADRNPAYRDALDKLHTSLSANGLTTPDVVEPFKAARSQAERATAVKAAAKKWGVDVQSADYVLQQAAKASSVKGTDKGDSRPGQSTKQPIEGDSLPKAVDGSNVLSPSASPDPSTAAFFTPPPVQGNLLNDNGGEWVKPLTSGEKAKPLYTPNSSESTRTREEIDGKSAIQRSMEEKERTAEAAKAAAPASPAPTSKTPKAEPQDPKAKAQSNLSASLRHMSEFQGLPKTGYGTSAPQFKPTGDIGKDLERLADTDTSYLDHLYSGMNATGKYQGNNEVLRELSNAYQQIRRESESGGARSAEQISKRFDGVAKQIEDAAAALDEMGHGTLAEYYARALTVAESAKEHAIANYAARQQEQGPKPKAAPTSPSQPDYGGLSHTDLLKVAQQKGVKIGDRDGRDELLQKIAGVEGAKPADNGGGGKPPSEGKAVGGDMGDEPKKMTMLEAVKSKAKMSESEWKALSDKNRSDAHAAKRMFPEYMKPTVDVRDKIVEDGSGRKVSVPSYTFTVSVRDSKSGNIVVREIEPGITQQDADRIIKDMGKDMKSRQSATAKRITGERIVDRS